MATTRIDPRTLAMGLGGLALGLLVAIGGAVAIDGEASALMAVVAGTVVVLGITLALLAVFLVLLPPLLPSR